MARSLAPIRWKRIVVYYLISGLTHENKGHDKEAINDYEHALSLNPDDWVTNARLGIVLTRSGHPKVAIAYFKNAPGQRPSDASIHRNLGLALQLAGLSDEAQHELAEAKSLDRH